MCNKLGLRRFSSLQGDLYFAREITELSVTHLCSAPHPLTPWEGSPTHRIRGLHHIVSSSPQTWQTQPHPWQLSALSSPAGTRGGELGKATITTSGGRGVGD